MMMHELPWILAAAAAFLVICAAAVWGSWPSPLQGSEVIPFAVRLRAQRAQRRRRPR